MSLDIDNTIHKLEVYNQSSFPILSIYLPIKDKNSHELIGSFETLIRNALNRKQQKQLSKNISYIKGFLEKYKNINNDQTLVLFTGEERLWEVIHSHFDLPANVSYNHSPNLAPLLEATSTYRRYLVVLVDREKAKLFTLYDDTIESEEDIYDPSVPQHFKGRNATTRAGKVDRHVRYHLYCHLKLISTKTQNFVKDKYVTGVIVGGHKTLIHLIEHYLPQRLQKKVVGELISELNISINDLVAKSIAITKKVNEEINQKQFVPTL